MRRVTGLFGIVLVGLVAASTLEAADPAIAPWQSGVAVRPVTPHVDRHTIHTYFNTSPESPDGRFVLYYTSATPEGEAGDLRVIERATGRETLVASGIVAEDAHRAACQQWSDGGRAIVYHNYENGRWQVVAVDFPSMTSRVLARDRQVAFGSPTGRLVPVYGCHWNPGPHRDIELIDVQTGEVRDRIKVGDVVDEYGDWIGQRFGTTDISLFFPIVSPDESRVFFKLSHPSGTDDFRSKRASDRAGKVVYDRGERRFVRLVERWGHPSWKADASGIFEKGNMLLDLESGKTIKYCKGCISNHPSLAPDGSVFVTDADVSRRPFGSEGDWAIAVGSLVSDEFAVLDVFNNTGGARSWRPNHPHPAFSADGRRIYYNTNSGPFTRLMVAERAE